LEVRIRRALRSEAKVVPAKLDHPYYGKKHLRLQASMREIALCAAFWAGEWVAHARKAASHQGKLNSAVAL